MTPQDFIAKWGPGGPAFDLNERVIDLCQLLGVPLPGRVWSQPWHHCALCIMTVSFIWSVAWH